MLDGKETDVAAATTDQPARERILDTAGRLFYRDGFVSVGVDTITRESGVAKMTLYRHFPSKDDLIVAYLARANERFWQWLESTMDPDADARTRIEQAFDAVAEQATATACLGCTFQHATADFPDPDHPAHAVALTNKQAMLERLTQLAAQADAPDPPALAHQLFLLMDGAWVAARMFDTDTPARQCGAAARALLHAHLDHHDNPGTDSPWIPPRDSTMMDTHDRPATAR